MIHVVGTTTKGNKTDKVSKMFDLVSLLLVMDSIWVTTNLYLKYKPTLNKFFFLQVLNLCK